MRLKIALASLFLNDISASQINNSNRKSFKKLKNGGVKMYYTIFDEQLREYREDFSNYTDRKELEKDFEDRMRNVLGKGTDEDLTKYKDEELWDVFGFSIIKHDIEYAGKDFSRLIILENEFREVIEVLEWNNKQSIKEFMRITKEDIESLIRKHYTEKEISEYHQYYLNELEKYCSEKVINLDTFYQFLSAHNNIEPYPISFKSILVNEGKIEITSKIIKNSGLLIYKKVV